MEGSSTIKCMTILKEFSRISHVDLGNNTILSTVFFIWLKKIKQARENIFAAVLTDFSKAFDCSNHELLIAKFNNYGFDSHLSLFLVI